MRDKAILEILYSTGARCNELVNIKSKDIDFAERFIKICQGKGGKERIVVYGKSAEEKIEKYLSLERFKQDPNNSNDYLFLNSNGSRLTTRSIQRILENFKKFLPAGKELSPHTLRHSFATHMLSAGACIRVVQELLGHSNLLTTELYTQISQTEMAKFLDEHHPLQDFKKKDLENDDEE
jgi:integrase/recombinase XerC